MYYTLVFPHITPSISLPRSLKMVENWERYDQIHFAQVFCHDQNNFDYTTYTLSYNLFGYNGTPFRTWQ
jgi:hypothetical protein